MIQSFNQLYFLFLKPIESLRVFFSCVFGIIVLLKSSFYLHFILNQFINFPLNCPSVIWSVYHDIQRAQTLVSSDQTLLLVFHRLAQMFNFKCATMCFFFTKEVLCGDHACRPWWLSALNIYRYFFLTIVPATSRPLWRYPQGGLDSWITLLIIIYSEILVTAILWWN